MVSDTAMEEISVVLLMVSFSIFSAGIRIQHALTNLLKIPVGNGKYLKKQKKITFFENS